MSATKRKSPIESATLFNKGTVMHGLDGKEWIVTVTSTGIKRWVPYKPSSIISQNGEIVSFKDDIYTSLKVCKPIKIATIEITSNKIGVGEFLFNQFQAKKGIWNIYECMFSLIAVHEDSELTGQKFWFSGSYAHSEAGCFAFWDINRIKQYLNQTRRGFKIRKNLNTKDGHMRPFVKKNKKGHVYFIYENDFDMDVPKGKPVGIMSENGYGDAAFPIFYGKNAYWIASADTYDVMLGLINE